MLFANTFFNPDTNETNYIGNLQLLSKIDPDYNLYVAADQSAIPFYGIKDIYYIDGIGWLCGNRILDLTDQSRMIKSVYTD